MTDQRSFWRNREMKNPGRKSGQGHTLVRTISVLVLAIAASAVIRKEVFASQVSATTESTIPVRYTDVRESAKITFQQDSTQTDEKYYLETMGTGVAWIDYDQDGLMDLYFVQSAATNTSTS